VYSALHRQETPTPGDLLPQPRTDQKLGINESLIGPMFYQMGEKRHGDSSEFNGIHQEMLDNKIGALLVVDDQGGLVGVVTMVDVAATLVALLEI